MPLPSRSVADERRVPLPLVGVAKEEEKEAAPVLLRKCRLPLPLWPDEGGRDGEPPEEDKVEEEEEVRGNMDGSRYLCSVGEIRVS